MFQLNLGDAHSMQDHGSTRFERWGAAGAGLISVIVGLGAGTFVAGLLGAASPMTALATSVIDNAPKSVERWAIDTFGTNDKLVLAWSVFGVLAVCGAAVGWRSRTSRSTSATAAAVLAAIGVLVTLAGRTARVASVAAVCAAAVVGWFILRLLLDALDPFRRQPAARDDSTLGVVGRRRFIGLGAASVVGGAALQEFGTRMGVQGLDDRDRLRAAAKLSPSGTTAARSVPAIPAGADLRIPGVVPWRVANDRFYRIDTAFVVPRVNAEEWKLTIGGMVDQKRTYTYEDLLKRINIGRNITLMCVSNELGGNLVGNAYFEGVRLSDLLEDSGVGAGVEQVFSTSVDGWTCGFPIEAALDGRDSMIALFMNGEPLPYNHGFPARLVVPGIYGYVSATKWLSTIELLRWSDAEGYWMPRGWSRLGPVKTSSRIDVPRPYATVDRGRVVLGGVAWAQHRGIDKVELQFDLGDWFEAKLAADGGIDTWRQWTYEWDASEVEPGNHLVRVRATDRTGVVQSEEPKLVAPDGAEGFHSIRVKVV
jgi:DMSO/TMAO reductase YedYZ molybdopterin-dependent catalytic subunit